MNSRKQRRSEMEGLMECPMCRSNYVRIVHIQLNNTFKPECDNCQIEGPYFHSEQSAIKWWNTRATDPLIEEMARLLTRYLKETPLGHQPHMIAHEVEDVLQKYHERKDAKYRQHR